MSQKHRNNIHKAALHWLERIGGAMEIVVGLARRAKL